MHTADDILHSLALIKKLILNLKEGELSNIDLLSNLLQSPLLKDHKHEIESMIGDLMQYCVNNQSDNGNALFIYAHLIYFNLHYLKNDKHFQNATTNTKDDIAKLNSPLLTESNKTLVLELLQKSEKLGCSEATCRLGEFYLKGELVPIDIEMAKEKFKEAIKMGNLRGMNELGKMYVKGFGMPINNDAALQLFERAADKKNIDALISLASMYVDGRGVLINYDKALTLAQQALKSDLPSALIHMATFHAYGRAVPRDSKAAIQLSLTANILTPEAAHFIGFIYQHAIGVTQDIEKARTYYKEAASRGHMLSFCPLARFYLRETPPNYKKAFELFSEAAQHGVLDAIYELGIFYENGWWIKKDLKKAVIQFERGITHHHYPSMNKLACALENGSGIKKDLKKAIPLYSRAAEEGNYPPAMYNLAGILDEKGTPEDLISAARLFRRAAIDQCIEAIDMLRDSGKNQKKPKNKLYYYHYLMWTLRHPSITKGTKFKNIEKAAKLAAHSPNLLDELIEFDCEKVFMRSNSVNLTFLIHFMDTYIFQVDNPLLINKLCSEVLKKVLSYEKKLDHPSAELQAFKKRYSIELDLKILNQESLFEMTELMIRTGFYFSQSSNQGDKDFTKSIANILTKAIDKIVACLKQNDCSEDLLSKFELIIGRILYAEQYHPELKDRPKTTFEDILGLIAIREGLLKKNLTEINLPPELKLPNLGSFKFFQNSTSENPSSQLNKEEGTEHNNISTHQSTFQPKPV